MEKITIDLKTKLSLSPYKAGKGIDIDDHTISVENPISEEEKQLVEKLNNIIITNANGTKFLADDGTYKDIGTQYVNFKGLTLGKRTAGVLWEERTDAGYLVGQWGEQPICPADVIEVDGETIIKLVYPESPYATTQLYIDDLPLGGNVKAWLSFYKETDFTNVKKLHIHGWNGKTWDLLADLTEEINKVMQDKKYDLAFTFNDNNYTSVKILYTASSTNDTIFIKSMKFMETSVSIDVDKVNAIQLDGNGDKFLANDGTYKEIVKVDDVFFNFESTGVQSGAWSKPTGSGYIVGQWSQPNERLSLGQNSIRVLYSTEYKDTRFYFNSFNFENKTVRLSIKIAKQMFSSGNVKTFDILGYLSQNKAWYKIGSIAFEVNNVFGGLKYDTEDESKNERTITISFKDEGYTSIQFYLAKESITDTPDLLIKECNFRVVSENILTTEEFKLIDGQKWKEVAPTLNNEVFSFRLPLEAKEFVLIGGAVIGYDNIDECDVAPNVYVIPHSIVETEHLFRFRNSGIILNKSSNTISEKDFLIVVNYAKEGGKFPVIVGYAVQIYIPNATATRDLYCFYK